jgi:hypothetical protein
MKKCTIDKKRQYLISWNFRGNLVQKKLRGAKRRGGMKDALYRNHMEAAL